MASLWFGHDFGYSHAKCTVDGRIGIGKQWVSDNNNHQDDNDDDDQKAITLTLLMSVFVGGCMGGLIQSFFMSPVELMKVNQQVVGKPAKATGMEPVCDSPLRWNWGNDYKVRPASKLLFCWHQGPLRRLLPLLPGYVLFCILYTVWSKYACPKCACHGKSSQQ
jgi:hypothetical protein